MLKHTLTAVLIVFSSTTTFSQQPSAFTGKWAGSMETVNFGATPVELVINDTGGTWRVFSKVGGDKNNACLGKEFPVVVTSQTATDLVFEVRGSEVIRGCPNPSVSLKSPDGKTLVGALKSGGAVNLIRQ